MGPELPAAPQPLQVLHVSEQEEDVFAFGMGLKQPVTKTTTAQAAIRERQRAAHVEQLAMFIPNQDDIKKEFSVLPINIVKRDLVPFGSYSTSLYHHCPSLWFLYPTAAISSRPRWICEVFSPCQDAGRRPQTNGAAAPARVFSFYLA